MTAKQKKLFLLTSMMSVFVMAVAVLFAGGTRFNFIKTTRATNSGNYSVSFSKAICGGSDYNTNDFTKESKLQVSGTPVYAHAHNAPVTYGSNFARFNTDTSAYIEFYIGSNMSFQEITGFSLTYSSSAGDFDIYLSSDGTNYPASPNKEVRNAPETVSLSAFNVKKIKFTGVANKYAYFSTIDINYSCGEAAPVSLTSIDVSGQTEEFTVGDTFSFGGVVTAHYSNGSSSNVTASATIDSSGVSMSTVGEYTVSVSYSDEFGSANTSYTVAVIDGGSITTDTYSEGSSSQKHYLYLSSNHSGYFTYKYTAWGSDPVYYTIHFNWSLSGSIYTFTMNSLDGDTEYGGMSGYYHSLFGGKTTNTGTISGSNIIITLRNRDGDSKSSSSTFVKEA